MGREFTKVGVVGLGTMGAGIAEVLRPQRPRRHRPSRSTTPALAARPRRTSSSSTDARGQPRQARPRRGRGRAARAGSASAPSLDDAGRPPTWSSRRCPSSSSSSARSSASSTGSARPRRSSPPTPPRCRSPRSRSPPARPDAGRRHALLQPGAGDEAGRGGPHRGHRRRTSSTTSRRWRAGWARTPVTVGDKAGFIANALLFGYLNHAVSMYEARYATREDIDAAMRLGCGLPMGPLALLDLIGLDTAYEILDTMYKQGARPAARPGADPASRWSTAGLLGRKTGRGFYTLRGAGLAGGRRRRADPGRDGGARQRRPRRSRTVGVVGSGTMADRHREVFAKAGYDVVLRRPQRGEGRGARARAVETLAGEGGAARQARARTTRDAALARLTGSTAAGRPGRRRPGRRGGRRGARASSRRCSRPSTRSASPARCWPRRPRRCRSSSARWPPSGPRDVVGHALLQPGAGDEAGRGGPHGRDRRRRASPRRARSCARLGKHAGRLRRPRRVHRQRAALPVPQRRGEDAARRTTPRVDDIDTAMKLGCGYPMGPFELLDVVGLDVSLAIQRELYLEFREPGLRAGAAAGAPGDRGLPRPQDAAAASATTRTLRPRRFGPLVVPPYPWGHEPRATVPPVARPDGGAPRRRWTSSGSAGRRGGADVERRRLDRARGCAGPSAVKTYRCPGCDQEIRPGDAARRGLAGRRRGPDRSPALAHRLLAGPRPARPGRRRARNASRYG